jgi:hypothetical protein
MTKMNWKKAAQMQNIGGGSWFMPTDTPHNGIYHDDIVYAENTPDGYFKFNGMNIQLNQIDKLIKKVQMM